MVWYDRHNLKLAQWETGTIPSSSAVDSCNGPRLPCTARSSPQIIGANQHNSNFWLVLYEDFTMLQPPQQVSGLILCMDHFVSS